MNLNPPSPARERIAIAAICLAMAIHVFVFCAAFPFDNNMDEAQHFDLVVKYSHGELPHGLQPMGEEASQYIMVFGSPEYMTPARSLPGQVYPAPFWLGRYGSTAERLDRAAEIARASETWQSISHQDRWTNYESSEQPLYYVCAGLWWKLGQAIGLEGLRLLYWLRFLNVLLLVPVAWLAGAIAKI
ncbi:MAG TPA: hypothetical protein VFV81_03520, partial [Verrucomicrobiae bacterium]|nr:hypothetical protein [Verrucomicrobiae bacterium]